MVESEPAVALFLSEGRQSFINCRPRAKGGKSCGTSFLYRLVKVVETAIVDEVVEIQIHLGGSVGEKEPPDLR